MTPLRVAALASLVTVPTVACGAILNLDEPTPYVHGDAAAFENPYADSTFESTPLPTEGGQIVTCNADVDSDAQNCGRCNRACGAGSSCQSGRCSPTPLVAVPSAPRRFVISDSARRGYVSLSTNTYYTYTFKQGTFTYQPNCYVFHVYDFGLDTPGGPLRDVAVSCHPTNQTSWGVDNEGRPYVWNGYNNLPIGNQGNLVRFDDSPLSDAGPNLDGGFHGGGSTVLPDASLTRPTVQPDPIEDGGVLVSSTTQILAVHEDGGIDTVLQLTNSPTPPGFTEFFQAVDPTSDGFGVLSSSGANQRVWAAPRPCEASTCGTASSQVYPSICGVRRFGDSIRWCSTALDPTGSIYDLLLLDMSASTGTVRILNSAATIARGATGAPILPVFYLDELGIYVIRNVKIDLLPVSGPIVPITATATRPLPGLVASDAKTLYWAEADAIYGVAK